MPGSKRPRAATRTSGAVTTRRGGPGGTARRAGPLVRAGSAGEHVPTVHGNSPSDRHLPSALIVEDDANFGGSLQALVESRGFEVAWVQSIAEAQARLEEATPDIALVDLDLPDGHGMDLRRDGHISPDVPMVVITGHATVESAVAALRQGVVDYLTKPLDPTELRAVLHAIERTRGLRRRIQQLEGDLREAGRFGRLIGRSKPMQRVYDVVARVAPTEASILLTGESGTGKEVVAATVHQMSPRAEGPFVAINCGAITDTLIESELFGHERGSFTGAHQLRKGVFEQAHEGTLLLDEISEMPLEMQVRLLRVLETSEVRRVGGGQTIRVDVRVVAATNRVPEDAIRRGQLREDLFYRLAVFPIRLPPLRERGDDVLLLAEHFLRELNQDGSASKRWAGTALDALRSRTWTGNVRELKNAVSHAWILAEEEIREEHLPEPTGGTGPGPAYDPSIATEAAGAGPSVSVEGGASLVRVPVGQPLAEAERALILATLERCAGNKRRTAETLGISVRTLYNRLHRYGEMDDTAEALADAE